MEGNCNYNCNCDCNCDCDCDIISSDPNLRDNSYRKPSENIIINNGCFRNNQYRYSQ